MGIEVYNHQRNPIKLFINNDSGAQIVPVEEPAKQQLFNVAQMPFIHHHVAVMPDVHWGMGAAIGSVIPTTGAIIPAAVGVDIGCGMQALLTPLTASDLPDNLLALRSEIERRVPHGRTDNGGPGDRGAWSRVPSKLDPANTLTSELDWLKERHPKLTRAINRAPHHVGTLGTGNHFIEVCLDESNRVWIMLHSGSRGVGNAIGTYFIEKAKEEMRRWVINLPDVDLAYLPEGSVLFDEYVKAVGWAQQFARRNREWMMLAVKQAVAAVIPKFKADGQAVETAIDCHHNYIAREHHFGKNVFVTRKGAVRARETDLGIIPGSMGARSYIVRGKGNPDSFHSCSHGAGRAMSRKAARKKFTVRDHIRATAGVECRKDEDVLDETPGAYKDIDAVMEAQRELVEVVHRLKAVLCVKG
ncbi:MAG: RtcB family protein [Acidobacteriota bacterium]